MANIEQAVRIVGDMLRAPLFPKGEVERERGVVLEELNLYFDTPTRFIEDLWEKVLYGDQPAGRYVGGTPETVRAIRHKDIVEHFRTYYRAPATVVALSGALTNSQSAHIATAHFGGLRKGETPDHPPLRETQKAPQVLTLYKKTDQMHMAVGFRGVSIIHPMRHAIAVLGTILGGTMSSRLFLLIRDRLGLAYSIHTSAQFDTETGSLVTFAGLKKSQAHKALQAILRVYREMIRHSPHLSEVKKAQEAMIGRFVLGLEQTDELAAFVAIQELLLRHIRTPQDEINSIRKVKPSDVQNAARFLFRADRLNLAVIGPDSRREKWYYQLKSAFPK